VNPLKEDFSSQMDAEFAAECLCVALSDRYPFTTPFFFLIWLELWIVN
jgi:hypothetical protein